MKQSALAGKLIEELIDCAWRRLAEAGTANPTMVKPFRQVFERLSIDLDNCVGHYDIGERDTRVEHPDD